MFRAFTRIVAEGDHWFVVIDTAPTGHTLLLLDAAESYQREVLRTLGAAPEEVRRLLPRLRDPVLTKILLVTLPEATPVHEAAALQQDLQRGHSAVRLGGEPEPDPARRDRSGPRPASRE